MKLLSCLAVLLGAYSAGTLASTTYLCPNVQQMTVASHPPSTLCTYPYCWRGSYGSVSAVGGNYNSQPTNLTQRTVSGYGSTNLIQNFYYCYYDTQDQNQGPDGKGKGWGLIVAQLPGSCQYVDTSHSYNSPYGCIGSAAECAVVCN